MTYYPLGSTEYGALHVTGTLPDSYAKGEIGVREMDAECRGLHNFFSGEVEPSQASAKCFRLSRVVGYPVVAASLAPMKPRASRFDA